MSTFEGQGHTVAILPSSTGKIHLYVLNSLNRWVWTGNEDDLSTNGKPFLEYRPVRDSTGAHASSFKGHFMIGYLANDPSYGNRAKVVFSTLVSRTSPPGSPGFGIQIGVQDYLQDKWATVREGSSPSLYSDSTIDNVFGITPLSVPTETVGLYYYPHADGSPDTEFRVYSDFRVMEDYICKKIGDVRDFECGSIDVMD